MLAESTLNRALLLLALNTTTSEYEYSPGACAKIDVFTRFRGHHLTPVSESDRTTIRRLILPARPDLTIAVTHMPSKLYFNEASQFFECSVLSQRVREVEQQIGHSRTLLVGDFNMNPFEAGMIAAQGLHSVMTRRIAEKQSRTVQGQSYPFFYNPMWNHFGDNGDSPAGTFYYERAEHVVYFWNMFDQVLVRPELMSRFDDASLQILRSDGQSSLLTNSGIPNKTEGPDHLPVLFRLNI